MRGLAGTHACWDGCVESDLLQVLSDLSRMCIVLRGLGKIFQRRLQPSFPFPVVALTAAVAGGVGGWCRGREDEGPLQGAAAGHDAVGAGMVKTADDVVVGADVAVGHDWNADGMFDRPYPIPIGRPFPSPFPPPPSRVRPCTVRH